MIKNLPREIDYLIFWDEAEQQLLQDPTLIRQAKRTKAEFQLEYETLTVTILYSHPSSSSSSISTPNISKKKPTPMTMSAGSTPTSLQDVSASTSATLPWCPSVNYSTMSASTSTMTSSTILITHKSQKNQKYQLTIHHTLLKYPDPEEIENEEEITTSDGSYNSEDEESDTEFEYPG